MFFWFVFCLLSLRKVLFFLLVWLLLICFDQFCPLFFCFYLFVTLSVVWINSVLCVALLLFEQCCRGLFLLWHCLKHQLKITTNTQNVYDKITTQCLGKNVNKCLLCVFFFLKGLVFACLAVICLFAHLFVYCFSKVIGSASNWCPFPIFSCKFHIISDMWTHRASFRNDFEWSADISIKTADWRHLISDKNTKSRHRKTRPGHHGSGSRKLQASRSRAGSGLLLEKAFQARIPGKREDDLHTHRLGPRVLCTSPEG